MIEGWTEWSLSYIVVDYCLPSINPKFIIYTLLIEQPDMIFIMYSRFPSFLDFII